MRTTITKEVAKTYIQAINLVNDLFKNETTSLKRFLTKCELTPDDIDDGATINIWDDEYGFCIIIKKHLHRFYLSEQTFNELPTLTVEEMINRYKLDIIDKLKQEHNRIIIRINQPISIEYKSEPIRLTPIK